MKKLILKPAHLFVIIFLVYQYSFSCLWPTYEISYDTISPGVVEKIRTHTSNDGTKSIRLDTVYRADLMNELFLKMDSNQLVFKGVIDSVVRLERTPEFYLSEDLYISVLKIVKGSLSLNSIVLKRRLKSMSSCDGSYSQAVNMPFLNFSNSLDSIDDLDLRVSSPGVFGNLFTENEIHAGYEPFWTTVEELQGKTFINLRSEIFGTDKKNLFSPHKRRGVYLIRDKKGYDLKGRVNQIYLPILKRE